MGEVYRAHDPSLKRDVAIKIVAETLAADPDRLRRFEQEALATASLNHPNILAVYDVGAHGGNAYVVSELLDGRTLHDVLGGGVLPLRKAVDYAAQIASGLAAAHEKGIVHRDLKPANLFVTADERVKILDFGIARMMRDSAADAGGNAATAATMTVPGAVLGTVGYMAPEQVRGETVDHRADIFSFGAVFYEMVARRRAFQRDSVPGTLASILDDQPPAWTGDGTGLAARVMRLISRCLEKQPRARFQSARDLSLVLSDEMTDTSMLAAAGRRRTGWPLVAAGAVILAVVAIAAWAWNRRAPRVASDAPSVAFAITLPPGDRWGAGTEANAAHPFAVSADGRHIVYSVARENVSRLNVRALGDIESRPLPGTEGASQPFFSPDGSRVAFFADGRLKTIAIDSGVVRVICPAETGRGGTWGEDNVIVFAPTASSALWRVAAGGGTPEPLSRLDAGRREVSHRYPQVLPGGSIVVFSVVTNRNELRVAALRLTGGDHVTLLTDAQNPHLMPGRIVYSDSAGELFTASLDPAGLSVTGAPAARHERPTWFGIFGAVGFSVSSNGTFLYAPFEPDRRRLAVVRRDGAARTLPVPAQMYDRLSISPDGQHAALRIDTGFNFGDVWLLDLLRSNLVPFTRDRRSRDPVWSPDGKRLVFSSDRNGVRDLFLQPVDGGSAEQISAVDIQADATSWSKDGALVFVQVDPKTGNDLWVMRPDERERAAPTPLLREAAAQSGGRISPDGRWLAFISNQSGRTEVYLTTFPTPGKIIPVSQGPGGNPRWSRSSDEIFFSRGSDILGLKVLPAGPAPGAPRPAIAGGIPGHVGYDVFPDGSFLVIQSERGPSAVPPLIVITGWADRPATAKK